jgi:hypothetical protein
MRKAPNARCAISDTDCADGGQDDDHEYMAASAFLYRNGQSRDRPMKRSRETLGLVAKTSEGQLMLICLVAFLCLGCAWAVDDGLFAAIFAIEAGSCGLREPLRFALRLIEPVLRIRALDTSKSRHPGADIRAATRERKVTRGQAQSKWGAKARPTITTRTTTAALARAKPDQCFRSRTLRTQPTTL